MRITDSNTIACFNGENKEEANGSITINKPENTSHGDTLGD